MLTYPPHPRQSSAWLAGVTPLRCAIFFSSGPFLARTVCSTHSSSASASSGLRAQTVEIGARVED